MANPADTGSHYFYRCDQVALAYADLNGAFDVKFKYWNDGDKPDLYFWVEYLIDGIWTTVYTPVKPCHTYWNYVCGSEVIIRLTDPRVRWECNDVIDGDIVWIKTIGASASVTRIEQQNVLSVIQSRLFNHIGLSDVFMSGSSTNLDISTVFVVLVSRSLRTIKSHRCLIDAHQRCRRGGIVIYTTKKHPASVYESKLN